MAKKSVFIEDSDPISKAKQLYEKWLRSQGYEGCAETYPAAIHASALVDDYFDEYPDRVDEHRSDVEEHAEDIGWLSDYELDDKNDDDDYDD